MGSRAASNDLWAMARNDRPARRRANPTSHISGTDRGSVLMLMPAAVLVVVVLAAITVDLSIVHLGEREVASTAAAIANNTATYAASEAHLYAEGSYTLDATQAQQIADTTLATQELSGHDVAIDQLTITGTTVTVTISMDVDYIFAKAIPGSPHTQRVQATVTANAEQAGTVG